MDICVGVCWNVWSSVAGCLRLLTLVQVAASLLPLLVVDVAGRNELFGLAGRGGIVVVMAQVPLFLVSFAV